MQCVVIPFDQMPKLRRVCPCCGVMRMPTEEELEQRITEQIDKESYERAIIEKIEIKSIGIKAKAVKR